MCIYKNADYRGYRKWRDEIMNNNIEINLNEDEQATLNSIKEDIMRDVRAEIAKNNTIIPTGFDGGKEISKIVKKAQAFKADYVEQVQKIDRRYKEEVANSKKAVLEQDMRYEMKSLAQDIDAAVEEDRIAREDEKARLLASDEYKDQKMENMQLLAMLAQANADIDYQTFLDLADVAIGAGDTTTIKYMGMMSGKQNASFANDIIHQINIAEQNKALTQFADSAKQFLVDGDISLTLMSHMKLYE